MIFIIGEVEEEVEIVDELVFIFSCIYLVDSGFVFNFLYFFLLRFERGVDVFFFFDFSVRKRDVEFFFEVKMYFKMSLFY